MWAISFTMEFPDKCLEIGAYLVDVILIRSELYNTGIEAPPHRFSAELLGCGCGSSERVLCA
jgi:hypothetical protein